MNTKNLRMDEHRKFYEEVGRRILAARKRRRPSLTQQALADQVSLTRTSITNVEKGRQKVLLHKLVEIAAALRVDVTSLIPQQIRKGELLLEKALRNRSSSEQLWIKSAVSAANKGRGNYGS